MWFVRLFFEGVPEDFAYLESLWLSFLRPLALAGLGIFWASLFVSAAEKNSRKKFWIWAFYAAAVFCAPYVPDMYASFVKAGEKKAIALSTAFYALGILTYGLIRGGSCLFVTGWLLSRTQSRLARSVVLYPFFLLSEFMFFHTWHPITYFPALPLPLPASSFSTSGKSPSVGTVLLETNLDGDLRSRIAGGGSLALSLLGTKLAEQAVPQLKSRALKKSVVVILPETFVTLNEISEVHSLATPVATALFEEWGVDSVVWIQGAFVANNNVVLGSELRRQDILNTQKENTPVPVFVLRKKLEQMPMFEAPSKGVSYSMINNDGSLVEQRIPEEFPMLRSFVESNRIMICYESLFPSNWEFGRNTVVLTNHHLFNEYRLMNWVYFGFLRQLSFIFNSPTKVVSNFNPSGVLFGPQKKESHLSSQSEGWFVVRFR